MRSPDTLASPVLSALFFPRRGSNTQVTGKRLVKAWTISFVLSVLPLSTMTSFQ
jgi:hypothetical protein